MSTILANKTTNSPQPPIPVFSTYKQRENQVSHSLAVTLEQCLNFRHCFLKVMLQGLPPSHPLHQHSLKKLVRHMQIAVQSTFGESELLNETAVASNKTIPDIFIQWDESLWANEHQQPCILIEAKVEAPWEKDQAQRYQQRAVKTGYLPVGVAITTTQLDSSQLPKHWQSLTWEKIYLVASSLTNQDHFWVSQLTRLLETTEEKLMASTTLSGPLTTFSGIPFADPEVPYHPAAARRVMKLLIQALLRQKATLNKVGISVSTPTSISSQSDGGIWYEADPASFFTDLLPSTYKPPHLNFTISPEHFSCGLTFPNSSFNALFKKGVQSLTEQDKLIPTYMKLLKRLNTLEKFAMTFTPYSYVLQQHYLSQKSTPHSDALLHADLRTLTGFHDPQQRLSIKENLHWLELMAALVMQKPSHCHLQAGVGIKIPYTPENLAFFQSPAAITQLIIHAWKALLPFGQTIVTHHQ